MVKKLSAWRKTAMIISATAVVATAGSLPQASAQRAITGYELPGVEVDMRNVSASPNELHIIIPEENPFNDNARIDAFKGYEFHLYRLDGVDVTTPEGHKYAKTLKVKDIDRSALTHLQTHVTGTEGEVIFRDLPAAVYFVEGKRPLGGQVDVQPMLIILPLTLKGGGWEHRARIFAKPVEDPPTPPTVTPPPPSTTTVTTTPPSPPTSTTTPPSIPPEQPPADPPLNAVLAQTGASVLGLVGVGAVLLLSGVFFMRKRKS